MQTPVWVHFNVPDLSFAGINKRNLVKIEMNLEDQHSPTWNSFGQKKSNDFRHEVFWICLLTSFNLNCSVVYLCAKNHYGTPFQGGNKHVNRIWALGTTAQKHSGEIWGEIIITWMRLLLPIPPPCLLRANYYAYFTLLPRSELIWPKIMNMVIPLKWRFYKYVGLAIASLRGIKWINVL